MTGRKLKARIGWSDEQLAKVGIDRARLARLMRKLDECGEEMAAMGLTMYGCEGSGHLIHKSRPTHVDGPGIGNMKADQGSVVATVGPMGWDGGAW